MSEPLPLGIHFGLDDRAYHDDPGLGSSSIRELARNPVKWQYARLRPREETEPEHLKWGHAWHCRVLEGEEAFARRYARLPVPSDYDPILTTTDSIKDFLRLHDEKLSGNKPELMARAKAIDGCPPIFDDILADWHKAHPDHVDLNPRLVQEIEDAVANMQAHPTLRAVMQAGSMIEGAAEMSIIYEVDGVRRKARFDYALAPTETRRKSLVTDLKSFTTFKGGSNEEAAARKVYDEAYDVQAAYYMDAFGAAKELLKAGLVFGDAPRPGYIESFLNGDGVDWIWVMLRRDAGMTPLILSIDTEDKQFSHARAIVKEALETYRSFVDRFGLDALWQEEPQAPLRLNYSVMPTYNRGLRYEQPAAR